MPYKWKKIDIKYNSDNDLLLEYRNCPICNNSKSKTVFTLENFQFFSDSSINPKQAMIQEQMCEECQAIYLNPCYSKKGFEILFEEAGQSYGGTLNRPLEQYNWIKERVEIKENTSLMDIGCGTGGFLNSLPSSIKKIGIDIDQPSIDIANKNNSNIEFICSAFEDMEYNDNVDIITMFHVLEHLPKPLETLKRLHAIANSSTKFIVEVPILENGLTNDINGFFSVQHLTHFTRNSLKNILNLSGWEIIQWQEQDGYNGCRVLVKKKKMQECVNIDFNQNTLLYDYLQNWYSSVLNAEIALQKIKSKKCLIWGGGMHLEFIYQISSLFHKDIEFIIVDKDKNKQNKTWRGIEIYDPSIIPNIINKNIFCIPSSYRNQEDIKRDFISCGVNEKKIICLYEYIKVY